MTSEARHRLAARLGDMRAPGSFSAQLTGAVDDLDLEVQGVGALTFPVPPAQAEQLCRLARPARYGRGERTLLDARVRDTWEIPKSRVKIDKRRWNNTLRPVLDRLGTELGLPPGRKLKAELHSMLVYGRGQFFLPHQDSERGDGMVGSLVVTLPSAFKGGDLVVEHGGQSEAYTARSARTSASFVAFYADCRHEVRPVRSGYRIVLTYDLTLGGPGATAEWPPEPEAVEAAAGCLAEHFDTPGLRADVPPDRLVYLLDHEYTQRGLGWSCLKGNDGRRAAVLRAAAERCGCDATLALADVQEVWSAYEPGWGRRWQGGGRRRRWAGWDGDGGDHDEDDEDDPWPVGGEADDLDAYELGELVDSSITLDHWVDEQLDPSTTNDEVCASTPSVDLRPYSSEYEGYMGNYGNTMDRWYRRAAVVVWPRSRAFVVRARGSALWAVGELSARLRAGEREEARNLAATLEPFWPRAAASGDGRLCGAALRVARTLDEPGVAAMLLRSFPLERLARAHARALAALASGYGDDWVAGLVGLWWDDERRPRSLAAGLDRRRWVASLPGLCQSLAGAGPAGASVANAIVVAAWRWLAGAFDQARQLPRPSQREARLAELAAPVLGLLRSAAATGSSAVRDEAVALLCDDREEAAELLGGALAVVRAAHRLPPAQRAEAGVDEVARSCARRIEADLARPPRADDDWSVALTVGCRCELCQILAAFLADPARRTFEWPIAEKKRQHVHSVLNQGEAPVLHRTRRTGSPYTLVLTKTTELHERERKARRQREADLAWLRSHW
jgi:hypothetical protein